ncbi:SRPBCC family protein [Streptomyces indicus]|uniref:Polyketide cyclase / dehydrase and lipid transport n=1 Tax=Streptomyces indicus TaxID=417292 RepID=A0A1G8UVX1_9ACTN|nr:SRPBCC family protein [Streptomyces indicus]SDJ57879.1 Polyketide cyclase / dehydrase and lipid transport [Streptomyces indicus]
MAVRHQLIRRSPEALWEVLGDETRYRDWVVGTHTTLPGEGDWPKVGSTLRYTVRLGPRTFEGHTVVRRHEPPGALELEAHSGPLGSARIAFDIRPWGEHTLVIMDEHPLRGVGGLLHNSALDTLLHLRHRRLLSRLAQVVEDGSAESDSSSAVRDAPGAERSRPAPGPDAAAADA